MAKLKINNFEITSCVNYLNLVKIGFVSWLQTLDYLFDQFASTSHADAINVLSF